MLYLIGFANNSVSLLIIIPSFRYRFFYDLLSRSASRNERNEDPTNQSRSDSRKWFVLIALLNFSRGSIGLTRFSVRSLKWLLTWNLPRDKANMIVSRKRRCIIPRSKANLNTYALCAGYARDILRTFYRAVRYRFASTQSLRGNVSRQGKMWNVKIRTLGAGINVVKTRERAISEEKIFARPARNCNGITGQR